MSIFAFGLQIGQSASQYYHTTIVILQGFFFFLIDIDSLLIAQGTALGEGHSYVYWQSSAQKTDKTSVSTGPSTDFTVPSTPESYK